MTETDLQRLLDDGARRLSLERALRLGLAALGGGVLLATISIFLMRLFPLSSGAMPGAQTALIQAALALPALLAAAGALAGYRFTQPDRAAVALLLDRRAASKEHLVTWFEFSRGSRAIDAGFRAAQLAATLQRAEALNPRKLLPLHWPEWSRALWLALLLLCSALLMPPRVDVTRGLPIRENRSVASGMRLMAGPADGVVADARRAPTVQVLTPTELLALQLKLSDPEMIPAAKAEALKDLLKKIGNVPESELAADVQDLLNTLRSESGVKPADSKAKPEERSGSQQTTGAQGAKTDVNPAMDVGKPANLVEFTERAFTQIGQSFPDIKASLESYYRNTPKTK